MKNPASRTAFDLTIRRKMMKTLEALMLAMLFLLCIQRTYRLDLSRLSP